MAARGMMAAGAKAQDMRGLELTAYDMRPHESQATWDAACDALYGEGDGRAALAGFEPELGALDLLALASRAAARVACEQSDAVEEAERLLGDCAERSATVWVVGEAADEHARRLEAAGQRALASADARSLPSRAAAGDLLLLSLLEEAPLDLLAEARRRRLDALLLVGARFVEHGSAVLIRVPCHDPRALELAHAFILAALCAESSGASRPARA